MKRPKVEAPRTVAPTLYEACERLAALVDEPLTTVGLSAAWVRHARSDIVALLAAVGWAVTLEQAAETPPVQDEAMF